jgi:riboflavin synthase
MFTGIITDLGRVEAVERRGDTRFRLATAYDLGTIELGASIACSGDLAGGHGGQSGAGAQDG